MIDNIERVAVIPGPWREGDRGVVQERGPDPGELGARFQRAAVAAGATRPCEGVFQDLAARYGEPHRWHHTLTHIDHCLVWLDWFCGSAERPEEVELALWFHDAVYSLAGGGNEHRSARLAREQLGSLGIGGASIDRIARHIEATEKHAAPGGDSALVSDLDLAILGASRGEFDLFEGRIRREYAHVPDLIYRPARSRVLQGFLFRPEIYRVPAIRAELEAPARANLERRTLELREGGSC